MPKPTAAAADIHTPASIAQISTVRPSSSSPWCARLRPSVAETMGARKALIRSLRRIAKYAATPAIARPASTSRMISTLSAPTSPSSP